MADGPSAEDTSSPTSSTSSSSSSALTELGDGGPAVVRIPRERHKRAVTDLSSSIASVSNNSSGNKRQLASVLAEGQPTTSSSSSSSSNSSRRSSAGSSERRGTRLQQQQAYNLIHDTNDLLSEPIIIGTSNCSVMLNNSVVGSNQQLKIASAVVLVERSEIAINIENNRKKLKNVAATAASAGNSSSGGVVVGAPKRDAKKDGKEPVPKGVDKVGASANAAKVVMKKCEEVLDVVDDDDDVVVIHEVHDVNNVDDDEDDDDDDEEEEEEDDDDVIEVLQDNKSQAQQQKSQPQQQQQQQRKTTRKTTAEAKKNSQLQEAKAQQQGRSANDDKGSGVVAGNLGPCAKKRCADRYDSFESSDSCVAVSCSDSGVSLSSGGSASSSAGSDITEPGSPCNSVASVSSDEGLGGSRGSPSLDETGTAGTPGKLAPTQEQPSTRPQWPWTPPIALTACSSGYKRFKAEFEHGCLPGRQAGQQHAGKTTASQQTTGNKAQQQQQQDCQGKITEYFKAQIKPQQSKTKKGQINESTVLVTKTSEFRRPATVQRNGKMGLAKYYLGGGNRSLAVDWEVRTLSQNMNGLQTRLNSKLEKKAMANLDKNSTASTTPVLTTMATANNTKSNNNTRLPILPIPSEMLSTLPPCKISNLRLMTEASPSDSPPPNLDSPISLDGDQTTQFKNAVHSPKSIHVASDNLSNSNSDTNVLSMLSFPPTPSDSAKDEDDEEESSRDSGESKVTSPILSTPTTIRFPVKEPGKNRSQSTDSSFCRWEKCELNFDTISVLLEHLQSAHINTQTSHNNFVCQWQGCKVQGKISCSRRWLERHVLSHGGNKPFQCIVDGCGSRFSSQTALERHVNGHFNHSESNKETSSRRSSETGGKLVKRNGKKLRYRKQPYSARNVDYFDTGVMLQMTHRLQNLEVARTLGQLKTTPGNSMTLTSQVMGRRKETDGTIKYLLRWSPKDIEPDEWVLESEIRSIKHVKIRAAANAEPDGVQNALSFAYSNFKQLERRVKQRRKPLKST